MADTSRSAARRLTHPPPPVLLAALCAAVGLAFTLYQISQRNALGGFSSYDDGVYFGASVRIVHGSLPYRDFVFVHPPGLPLLMAPLALLSDLTGTRVALEIARVLTSVIAGLNAGLAAMVVRRRGAVAVLTTGLLVATFPLEVAATHTLLLEPWFVFFVLLAALSLFRHSSPSPRTVFIGGVLLGIAVSIKIWAIFPAAALAVCWLIGRRREFRRLIGGAVASFVVITVVFFALAPRAFVHDVVLDQLGRHADPPGQWSIAERMLAISGVTKPELLHGSSDAGVWVMVGAVVAVAAAILLIPRPRELVDWFALLAGTFAVGSMLVAPEFYQYYGYFPHAFMAVAIGLAVGRVVSFAGDLLRQRDAVGWVHALPGGAAGVAVVILALVSGRSALSFTRAYLAPAVDPASTIDLVVPKGSCLLADEPSLALLADRFSASASGCPSIVDSYGTWLAAASGSEVPTLKPIPTKLITDWQSWAQRADFVVLSVPGSNYLPFDSGFGTYFRDHYALIISAPRAYVYARNLNN